MPQRVYIETTIVSYLTAWPSRDLIMAGHQQITHDWWEHRRGDYDLRAIFRDLKEQEKQSGRDVVPVPNSAQKLSGEPCEAPLAEG